VTLPETAFSRAIARTLARLAGVLGWIWIALLSVIVANVVLRYVFGQGRIEFEEIQWHLYAVGMMLGIPICFADDAHIRVDVLRERMPDRLRAWVELYGLLLLLLPFAVLVLLYGLPFVAESFAVREVSQAPGGLPLRWLIKAVLPLAFFLLLLAALARTSRLIAFLFPIEDDRADP
jgi:TRAP-type mannitol/chloroaromatic compound transport system permease small subunit